ncbi:GDSL-type esterase/lipase family protein [Psychrobacter sp. I-STPA10]|uniref:GDSL-type esterase/lipase family protein n=1 Tax=Psychrobacter sp. I-STPA10 TaxID=2585769 RepID=UPI001E415EEB|nr:GDSL-type esterase/lipase family protein [Psychrobacter sp. I-STPA10]
MLIKQPLSLLACVLMCGSLLGGCDAKPEQAALANDAQVVALGDSLTYGYGATPETAYPAVLDEMTQWRIHNAGVNGNTSADVLARLDDIIATKPDLVLLGVGGNDVLQRIQPATTKANIIQIIQRLKAANIPVVLIAEPHFSSSALFGRASDNPIYEDIADSEDVPLFADGWSKILSDDSLKSDQIHANAQGYQQFAENLHEFLQQQGYAKK